MVQREAAERFAAAPRTPAYGAVSVKAAYWGNAKVVGHVPASVFVPRPNVESALVEITRHEPPATDPDTLFALVAHRVRPAAQDAAPLALGDRRAGHVRRRRHQPDRSPRGTRRRRLVSPHRRPPRCRGRPAVTPPTRPSDAALTLRAHAKLTLGLRITGVRADGYHLIDAEMVSLDLHDVLTVTPGRSASRPRDRSPTACPSTTATS